MDVNSSAEFEQEVLKADKPVLVDFFATWCGPCRMVAPILKQIERDMADTVKVVKVDVDQNKEVAAKYGVMSIPTMIMFKEGKEAAKNVGAMPKEALVDFINANA